MTIDSPEPLARPRGPRYQPIAQIGRGGMAEVLLAMMDAGCGARRLVVLKRIWPELATDPEFMTMFLDEARLSVRMNHPNVVRTYEVLAHGAEATIAMEYLDGQPLIRVMNRLRGTAELSVPLRLRILMSVLAGLEHAHTLTDLDGKSLEVVHRDVSPHNVFVTYDGQVKLVDFGVAKTLAASHHTRPGALKGKLAYMAPEQLQPVEVDRRADLFAVGVMLWEMLSGRRLWQGMNEVQIVSQLAAGLPFPPLPMDAGLPPGLDAICEQALHPNPQYRYQTAAEMEEDLERVLIGSEDSHARNLGRVVSLAFSAERAERQGLIEASSRLEVGADIPMAPPPRDAEPEATPSGAERPRRRANHARGADRRAIDACPGDRGATVAGDAVGRRGHLRSRAHALRRRARGSESRARRAHGPPPVVDRIVARIVARGFARTSRLAAPDGRGGWVDGDRGAAGAVRWRSEATRLHRARGRAGRGRPARHAAPLPAGGRDPAGGVSEARGARALLGLLGGARRRGRCARSPAAAVAATPPRSVAG